MASNVFRRHVFGASLRDQWQRCAFVAVQKRVGANEGSNRTAVAVAGVRRQLNTYGIGKIFT